MTPYPLHVMPGPIAEYIRCGAEALGCDPAYIAVPMLPVLASAIGNTRRIRLKRTWSEPAVIWAAIVGESGTAKSPALDLAAAPVWLRQRAIIREHERAMAEYADAIAQRKALPKDERGDEPDAPPAMEHPIVSDITIEALADRLLATPRGTLIALDELAAWFASFARYKDGSDVPHWLALHGARAMKVDRKTGDRTTIYVPHAAVSLTGTIQPGTLRRMLLPEYYDSGLAARLLLAMPPMRAKRWTDHEIPDDLSRAMADLMAALYALRPDDGADGYAEPRMIDLTDGARQTWIAFVDRHGETMQDTDGHERAALAKLEGYAARIALVLYCCRVAVGETDSDYIETCDIEGGITLAQWFGGETRRVYQSMSETNEDRQRRELLDWIAGRGGRVTARDVQRGLSRYTTSEAAEQALQALVDRADGSWETIATGQRGRPATYFAMTESPDYPFDRRTDTDGNAKTQRKTDIPSVSAANGRAH